MKRSKRRSDFNDSKKLFKERKREHDGGGFRCSHCRQFVVINERIGTANRNHCNICLWSKHVDISKGDRLADCHGGMGPVGLTFKHEGFDRTGELMLIHLCSLCSKISINRIARDDLETRVVEIFEQSWNLSEDLRQRLSGADIYLLQRSDEPQLTRQLFGL